MPAEGNRSRVRQAQSSVTRRAVALLQWQATAAKASPALQSCRSAPSHPTVYDRARERMSDPASHRRRGAHGASRPEANEGARDPRRDGWTARPPEYQERLAGGGSSRRTPRPAGRWRRDTVRETYRLLVEYHRT